MQKLFSHVIQGKKMLDNEYVALAMILLNNLSTSHTQKWHRKLVHVPDYAFINYVTALKF